MEENKKKRLEFLKSQLKQREYEKRVIFEKERLISEHIDFVKYYRFADQNETDRIHLFLLSIFLQFLVHLLRFFGGLGHFNG